MRFNFRLSSLRPLQPRIVPVGPHIANMSDSRNIINNSARRLEVLIDVFNAFILFHTYVVFLITGLEKLC